MNNLCFDGIKLKYKQPPAIAMMRGVWFEVSSEGFVFRYLAYDGIIWILGQQGG